jgi:hypothetical protein
LCSDLKKLTHLGFPISSSKYLACGTDAIALKVKQEFAAKEKMQTAKKTVAKSHPKAVKKAKAA